MRPLTLALAVSLAACAGDDSTVSPSSAPDTAQEAAVVPASRADDSDANRPLTSDSPQAATNPSADLVAIDIEASIDHADGPSDLTLRSEPSTRSAAVATMPHDADVFVEACQDLSYDDAWCRLRYEPAMAETTVSEGWAKRRHLVYLLGAGTVDEDGVRWYGDFLPVEENVAFTVVGPSWDIQADDGYANVRSGPSADAVVIARLDNGTLVEVSECSAAPAGRRWCAVSGPAEGYVHQSGFHQSAREF